MTAAFPLYAGMLNFLKEEGKEHMWLPKWDGKKLNDEDTKKPGYSRG